MGNFDKLSNEQLGNLLKEMEETHTNIRTRMLSDFDNLERVERDYEKVRSILKKRLK